MPFALWRFAITPNFHYILWELDWWTRSNYLMGGFARKGVATWGIWLYGQGWFTFLLDNVICKTELWHCITARTTWSAMEGLRDTCENAWIARHVITIHVSYLPGFRKTMLKRFRIRACGQNFRWNIASSGVFLSELQETETAYRLLLKSLSVCMCVSVSLFIVIGNIFTSIFCVEIYLLDAVTR